ncbi:MAG TPA: hypothetical protein VN828_03735, partial [Acidobacteriaceae bacterium]|nr:hypothetical protein [Acidobacteriaceae bacterium]
GSATGAAATPSLTGILGGALGHIPGVGSGAIPNFLTSLLPHFANGGDYLANSPMVVGEYGPEILTPRVAGTVTPNSQIGGSNDLHINVDARGSNDPASIHAAVSRAVSNSVVASMHAQHQSRMRTPHGR